jgi:D-3-phosphoglycerate dehydrogenase
MGHLIFYPRSRPLVYPAFGNRARNLRQTSLDKDKIKILLLEGVHPCALESLRAEGYQNVDQLGHALQGDELAARLGDVHMLGIRSRTQLTAEVLSQTPRLKAVGCFCIGTNQVDLAASMARGVPVFNAPYSNTRSVAELVLAEAILLLRGVPQKTAQMHEGVWQKSASSSFEVRGKTLGVVGYGNIGSQLGVLAEGLGMNVIFYDVVRKLNLGNARQVESLDELLGSADVVSLHVPANRATADMIGADELERLKQSAVLINASRGNVVDLKSLANRIRTGKLLGAAIDVYPEEPKSNNEPFVSDLRGLPNVILTPHIGGSTMEAQENIGREVAEKLIRYSDNGSTRSAVNFPEVSLPEHSGQHRLLHIHKNAPGVLTAVNQVLSAANVNIAGQYLQTNNDIGYVVIDVEAGYPKDVRSALKAIDGTIRTRVLY